MGLTREDPPGHHHTIIPKGTSIKSLINVGPALILLIPKGGNLPWFTQAASPPDRLPLLLLKQ